MVTKRNLIYSIAAARRIIGGVFPIVRVEKWFKVCLVVFEGCRARFMSQRVFLQHFVAWRKRQAIALTVTPDPSVRGTFLVENAAKSSQHLVHAFGRSGIGCSCEDAENQLKFLGRRGCCKHGYAVLNHLGFDSLRAYIASNE